MAHDGPELRQRTEQHQPRRGRPHATDRERFGGEQPGGRQLEQQRSERPVASALVVSAHPGRGRRRPGAGDLLFANHERFVGHAVRVFAGCEERAFVGCEERERSRRGQEEDGRRFRKERRLEHPGAWRRRWRRGRCQATGKSRRLAPFGSNGLGRAYQHDQAKSLQASEGTVESVRPRFRHDADAPTPSVAGLGREAARVQHAGAAAGRRARERRNVDVQPRLVVRLPPIQDRPGVERARSSAGFRSAAFRRQAARKRRPRWRCVRVVTRANSLCDAC